MEIDPGRQVVAADQPLVALFDAEHAGESDQRMVVGEDADDVGAPTDIFVEALERVRRAQLAPVRRRERVEREDVRLGVLEHAGDRLEQRARISRDDE
jgi:hypothetical protein